MACPAYFSKCVILSPLFILSPPFLLGDRGDMCTLLCCHGYHKHPTQKILHRITSGQLRLFALQQTSGLEAFSCQRHKLFLCLQGKRARGRKGEGKEEGRKRREAQIWKEHTNAVWWQVSPCSVRWESSRTEEREKRRGKEMLLKRNSGAQGTLNKWRGTWQREAEKEGGRSFQVQLTGSADICNSRTGEVKSRVAFSRANWS